MDAATKIKTLLTTLVAGFILTPDVRAKDEPTPPTGIAAIVSEWLSKTPQFSLGRPINADSKLKAKTNKLGTNAPFVAESLGKGIASPQIFTVRSDQGGVGTFTVDGLSGTVLRDESTPTGQGPTALTRTLHITMPMKFSEHLHTNTLGSLVTEVIACGHRICSGTQCYDIKDEPVSGTRCDVSGNTELSSESTHDGTCSDEEPIQVAPMAPPPPPPVQVAMNSNETSNTDAIETGDAIDAIMSESKLQDRRISVPLSTLMELMVAKTELNVRLEMTEQMMLEREAVVDKIQQISERNAQLATQLAVAEARQQMSDILTASVVEKAEIAMRYASPDSTAFSKPDSNRSVQAIHEDLSNIRRQIALLRRTQPVAFAPSFLGIRTPTPYVPTGHLQPYEVYEGASHCALPPCDQPTTSCEMGTPCEAATPPDPNAKLATQPETTSEIVK